MSDFALAIALYTLVAYIGRKSALIYSGWLLAGTLLWSIFQVGEPEAVLLVFVVFVIFGFSWAMGEFIGARRAYQSELEQRLAVDPLLRPGGKVPFYRLLHNRFARELL